MCQGYTEDSAVGYYCGTSRESGIARPVKTREEREAIKKRLTKKRERKIKAGKHSYQKDPSSQLSATQKNGNDAGLIMYKYKEK